MMASATPVVGLRKKLWKLFSLYLIVDCFTVTQLVVSFGAPAVTTTTTRTISIKRHQRSGRPNQFSSSTHFPLLFATPSDEENVGDTNDIEEWDHEESLLVMNLSPLPDVSCEDCLSRISQYIRSFPFAAVLPVQPLQALPTDDGGLELKFLRKKTETKSGLDGGVRFFVHLQDEKKDDVIEVVIKRNSEGQTIPKMFAEKLIIQSFVKGMALGSDSGNDDGRSSDEPSSPVKVPNTRIESPTKDMAKMESVFHKWL